MSEIDVIAESCLEFDPGWARECAMLYCDPPYSEYVHSHTMSSRSDGQGPAQRDFGFDALSPDLRRHIARCAAEVSSWSLIYSDHESTHLWREACTTAGAQYIRTIPWVRWTQPQISGDRPPSGSEVVLLFWGRGRKKRWNGPGSLVSFEDDEEPDLPAMMHTSLRASKIDPKHPTEKPLDQALDIVSWFSDPGSVVLDLTCGRGTSATACALLGRHFRGFEASAEVAAAASRRASEAAKGHLVHQRDVDRVARWRARAERLAPDVPRPEDPSQLRTWERAQRRRADLIHVVQLLETRK